MTEAEWLDNITTSVQSKRRKDNTLSEFKVELDQNEKKDFH